MDRADRLRDLYRAFNARDIDAVLAALSDDVDWPNGWEGGRVRGHAAVRDYWTRQWAAIDPRVEPVAIAELDDDRVRVDVHQVVRDLGGTVVADARVGHTYTFGDHGLVVRMDIDD